MECKACGTWYVSSETDGVCLSCKTRLKKMGLDLPYDRLRELVEADRDGRCVVLPCKVGDILYYSDDCGVDTETVEKIVIEVETDGGIYRPLDIGETIFLTRKAAESALKGDNK